MKAIYFITTLLLISLMACKATREGIKQDYQNTKEDLSEAISKSPEEIQEERVTLSSEIAAQRTKIEYDLDNINDKEFGDDLKQDAEHASEKLKTQLDDLDEYTDRISDASDDQWENVKNEVENSLSQMNDEREELTKKLFADME